LSRTFTTKPLHEMILEIAKEDDLISFGKNVMAHFFCLNTN